MSTESVENTEQPIVKTKKVLSPAQLEALKLARERAREKRLQIGEISQREKKAKQDLLNERIKKIEKIEEAVNKKTTQKKKPVIESESESESESSSSEEEEVVKPRRKPKPRAQVVKKQSTDRLASDVAKDELKQRILQSTYRSAFASLFPNHKNLFD